VNRSSAAVEAYTIARWFEAARERQARHAAPAASPLVTQSADVMARHIAVDPARVDDVLSSMAFWQLFLPSALASDRASFSDVRARLPRSFDVVRRQVAGIARLPQAVFAAFHMAAFPLVAAMLAAAVMDEHGEPGHVLVGRRNLAWLELDASRWVTRMGRVIGTDARGLRQLQAGLRDGSIRRLLILVDGPHPPGPGTEPLATIPTLGFKTGLLERLLARHVPVLPLTHAWEGSRLELAWRPPIDDADPAAGAAAIARLIEELLHRHPEQWLNWASPYIMRSPPLMSSDAPVM
jgi:hypothetical protein